MKTKNMHHQLYKKRLLKLKNLTLNQGEMLKIYNKRKYMLASLKCYLLNLLRRMKKETQAMIPVLRKLAKYFHGCYFFLFQMQVELNELYY